MSFAEAVAQLPLWVRIWVQWLSIVMIASPILLLVWRASRRDGLIVAVATGLIILAGQALYAQVGFVRLLGLPHVLIWGPLAVYLGWRLRRGELPMIPRVVMGVLLASICISLVFDVVDVARWIAGERAPMVTAPTDGA